MTPKATSKRKTKPAPEAEPSGMVRISVLIPRETLAALKAELAKTGVPVSTNIRFGIDARLKSLKEGQQ
jgi:hypothetical protein